MQNQSLLLKLLTLFFISIFIPSTFARNSSVLPNCEKCNYQDCLYENINGTLNFNSCKCDDMHCGYNCKSKKYTYQEILNCNADPFCYNPRTIDENLWDIFFVFFLLSFLPFTAVTIIFGLSFLMGKCDNDRFIKDFDLYLIFLLCVTTPVGIIFFIGTLIFIIFRSLIESNYTCSLICYKIKEYIPGINTDNNNQLMNNDDDNQLINDNCEENQNLIQQNNIENVVNIEINDNNNTSWILKKKYYFAITIITLFHLVYAAFTIIISHHIKNNAVNTVNRDYCI